MMKKSGKTRKNKFSYSRVSTYLSCPYKHYLSYERLLKETGVVRPLTFGSDIHKLLELRGKPKETAKYLKKIKEDFYTLPPNQQSKLGEDYPDDIAIIFTDYMATYQGEPLPDVTEHEFLIPMGKLKGDPIMFHGFIDEIYTGARTIGEHKSFNQRPDMGTLAMNTQVALYSKAYFLETGVKLDKVLWDYIHSTPAKSPIWLDKSKRFSEAANSNITPSSYIRAHLEHGITSKSDPELIARSQRYEANNENFFFRRTMDIPQESVDSIWSDFKDAAKMILIHPVKTKNITRDCNWCQYRPICYSELTGGDTEYIISQNYTVKEEEIEEND